MPAPIDITGQTFNRLTAIARVKGRRWRFRCECGEEIVQDSAPVKNGNTKSCGCLSREITISRSTKHGFASRDCRHPLYDLWVGMKSRCLNPNHVAYPRYGGAGITVCDRWLSFSNFVSDMGPRPTGASLDRINGLKGYEPTNCRWANRTEQSENTCRNQYLEVDGERLTVSQWARKLGVDQRTLNRRRALGWSDRDVITKPIKRAS